MSRRLRRLPDVEISAIETSLRFAADLLSKIPKETGIPAVEARIDRLYQRMAHLERRALRGPPETPYGLATQARIVASSGLEPSAVKALLANVQAMTLEAQIPGKGIRLQADRRYRCADGYITEPLSQLDSRGHVFADDCSGDMFEADGRCIDSRRDHDVVEEVTGAARIAA